MRRRLCFCGLLLVHAALILYSARVHSVTYDEAAHIPSGLVHWAAGNYSPYRANPPLWRMLATLPLEVDECNLPAGAITKAADPFKRVEWDLGIAFHQLNRERYDELVFRARWVGALWSCLAAGVIFAWARELYGERAGWLAMVLWCFEPNVLGHAAVAAPDIPCAVAGLLAMYAVRTYRLSPSNSASLLAGGALGLAQLTKFTLLALLPVAAIRMLSAPVREHSVRFPRRLMHTAVAMSVAVFVINLGYEFQGTGRRLADLSFLSSALSGRDPDHYPGPGNRFIDSWLGRLPIPLPEDYVRGIDQQQFEIEMMHRWRPSYLAGDWQDRGWWYYYLYAFAVKLPVGELLLIMAGVTLAVVCPRRWPQEWDHYLPALVILVLLSVNTGYNHHARYAWPVIPFLLIGAGKVLAVAPPTDGQARPSDAPSKVQAGVAYLLASWAVFSSLWFYPHSMSYFNELAGGPGNGHAHLVDSNIDWGQDILLLRHWLEEHPESWPVRVALTSLIDYDLPGSGGAPPNWQPEPGWYAVSVNALRGMGSYHRPQNALSYFQRFRPVARSGYSIYIYYLTTEDIAQASLKR